MEWLIIILFALIVVAAYFVINYWWILLIIIGLLLLAIIIYAIVRSYELKQLDNNVVIAELIGREPIVEQVCENTGHTTSYGRHLSYHEHYRNRNVITGYTVRFNVLFKNGKRKVVECNENSEDYKKLIVKIK